MTDPGLLASFRDLALVARFEVVRARRTWQALAVVVLFAIAAGGATYSFTEALLELENRLAETLGVPLTDRPGAMLDVLQKSDDMRRLVRVLVSDPSLVDEVLQWPIVAVFHFWTSVMLVPFLAAFVSADTISDDVRTRAIRFELLRTGRLELVYGRFLGQLVVLGLAIALAGVTAFGVAWWFMILPDPLTVAYGFAVMSLRAFAWGVPFVGVGVACSECVKSAMWARILALLGTTGLFVTYGLLMWARFKGYGGWVAPLLALSPSAWVRSLWAGGLDVWLAALYLGSFAVAVVGAGFLVLRWRDA